MWNSWAPACLVGHMDCTLAAASGDLVTTLSVRVLSSVCLKLFVACVVVPVVRDKGGSAQWCSTGVGRC